MQRLIYFVFAIVASYFLGADLQAQESKPKPEHPPLLLGTLRALDKMSGDIAPMLEAWDRKQPASNRVSSAKEFKDFVFQGRREGVDVWRPFHMGIWIPSTGELPVVAFYIPVSSFSRASAAFAEDFEDSMEFLSVEKRGDWMVIVSDYFRQSGVPEKTQNAILDYVEYLSVETEHLVELRGEYDDKARAAFGQSIGGFRVNRVIANLKKDTSSYSFADKVMSEFKDALLYYAQVFGAGFTSISLSFDIEDGKMLVRGEIVPAEETKLAGQLAAREKDITWAFNRIYPTAAVSLAGRFGENPETMKIFMDLLARVRKILKTELHYEQAGKYLPVIDLLNGGGAKAFPISGIVTVSPAPNAGILAHLDMPDELRFSEFKAIRNQIVIGLMEHSGPGLPFVDTRIHLPPYEIKDLTRVAFRATSLLAPSHPGVKMFHRVMLGYEPDPEISVYSRLDFRGDRLRVSVYQPLSAVDERTDAEMDLSSITPNENTILAGTVNPLLVADIRQLQRARSGDFENAIRFKVDAAGKLSLYVEIPGGYFEWLVER